MPNKSFTPPKESDIKRVLLDAYREFGRVRIPLPALVAFAMRRLGVSLMDHVLMFPYIHGFIRSHWGNDSLFSRRRGRHGGIKIRDKVKL